MARSIVGISGNLTRPSRTRTLVEAVVNEVVGRGGWNGRVYDLVDAMPGLVTATSSASSDTNLSEIWDAIGDCDALVVGSPVYKASYAGLLKHLFDLMDMNALKDRPVAVVATAKAPQHYLMIEHQFKPLFGFFGARIVSGSIFATDAAFTPEGSVADSMSPELDKLASQLLVAAQHP